MDFPIAVDAFNLLGVKVVPLHILIDGEGKIVSLRPSKAQIDDLIASSSGRPVKAREAVAWQHEEWLEQAMSAAPREAQLDELRGRLAAGPMKDRLWFQLGVLARMRYEQSGAPEHFEEAVMAWQHALSLDPNQYIWRRRLQQYGPRLDKPYPFYDWVKAAREEIVARGEKPIELTVEPEGAELARPYRVGSELVGLGTPGMVHPDPQGKLQADEGFVKAHAVLVADTQNRNAARVHLELRLVGNERAHWNNEDAAPELWLDLPEQCLGPKSLRMELAPGLGASSQEARRFEFELSWPAELSGSKISASLFYAVCEDVDGMCLYRRQDVEIILPGEAPTPDGD